MLFKPGLSKRFQQSRLFGFLIGLGVFLIIIAILAIIQVTPYGEYKNKSVGIRLKYPSYWQMVDQPAGGAIVVFVTPLQTAMDTYNESVNISLQDLSAKPMALSQFSQLAIRQFTGTFKEDIEIVDSSPTTLAGLPAHRFSYVATTPEKTLKFLHIWVVAGNRAFIFTYGGAEQDFDFFWPQVQKMIDSFRVS